MVASPEVISDSEEEKHNKTKEKSKTKDPVESASDKAEEEAEGSEEEEEYEIEAILDAKNGAFPEGRMGYLVKWKGYDAKHNSWVDELDAGNAQELIDDYWTRTKKDQRNQPKTPKGSRRKSEGRGVSQDIDKKRKKSNESKSKRLDDAEESDAQIGSNDEGKPRKRARASETKPKEKPKMIRKESSPVENDMDVDETEGYIPVSGKIRKQAIWENIVKSIDTIERKNDTLNVFFTLKNGSKVFENSEECAKRFPQKLIKFYESHLRWSESDT